MQGEHIIVTKQLAADGRGCFLKKEGGDPVLSGRKCFLHPDETVREVR